MNSRFPIDHEQEDVYHHQTTMRVNSSLEIIIRSTFVYSSSSITDENIMKTTANFRTFPLTDHNTPNDVKVMGITLVSWQLGLIGCVFTILMMGLTTSIIVIIVLLRKGNLVFIEVKNSIAIYSFWEKLYLNELYSIKNVLFSGITAWRSNYTPVTSYASLLNITGNYLVFSYSW